MLFLRGWGGTIGKGKGQTLQSPFAGLGRSRGFPWKRGWGKLAVFLLSPRLLLSIGAQDRGFLPPHPKQHPLTGLEREAECSAQS